MKVGIEQLKSSFAQNGYSSHVVEKHIEKLANESLDDEGWLLPPWLKYPEIPDGSIGWRMGAGEDYMILCRIWFACLSKDEKALYKKKYPKIRS